MPNWVRRPLERRAKLKALKFDRAVAVAMAHVSLAAYEAKSDIEWDLHFLTPLDKRWRGEVFAAIWALPVLALFIPYTRPMALQFFTDLKAFDPHAPLVYLSGWTALITATFGVRALGNMFGGGYGNVVSAMSNIPDEIPASAVDAAASNINAVPTDPG